MGRVLHLFATPADVERAWKEYDAARLAELAAYRDEASAPHDRFALSTAVVRAHREFVRVFDRWPEDAAC